MLYEHLELRAGVARAMAQDELATASGHRHNLLDEDGPAPQVAREAPGPDDSPEKSAADVSAQFAPPQVSNGPIALFESVQKWIARLIDLDLKELLDIAVTNLDRDTNLKSESGTPTLNDLTHDATGTLGATYLDRLALLGIERLLNVNIHDLAERLAREWGPSTGHFDGASNGSVAAEVSHALSALIDLGLQGLLGKRISQVDLGSGDEPDSPNLSSGTSVYHELDQPAVGSATELFGLGSGSSDPPVLDAVGNLTVVLSERSGSDTTADAITNAAIGPISGTLTDDPSEFSVGAVTDGDAGANSVSESAAMDAAPELQPDLSVTAVAGMLGSLRRDLKDRYLDGLRTAGLPE